MDTAHFRAQVDGKIDEIEKAYLLLHAEGHVFSPRFNLNVLKPRVRELLLSIAPSDPAAATLTVNTLDDGVGKLHEIASNEMGTPLESIRGDITEWYGLGKTSFEGYLNGVENALQYQLECAVIADGLIKIQLGLINAGQECALQIADHTIAAFTNATAEEQKSDREMLASIVDNVVKMIGSAVQGPAAAVSGIISGIGGIAGAAIKNGGTDPNTIILDMFQEILKIESEMRGDRRKLGDAIKKTRFDYFTEDRSLLPPDIGLTAV